MKVNGYHGAKLKDVGWRPCTELYLMFGGKCSKCNKGLTFEQATIDHVFPRASKAEYENKACEIPQPHASNPRKSIHEVENLTILCHSCNSSKQDKPAKEFFGEDLLEIISEVTKARLPKSEIDNAVPGIAAEKPNGKYARLALAGKYYRPE